MSVNKVILVSLDEGTDELRTDELDLVAKRHQVPRHMMGAGTGFHDNGTGMKRGEEGNELLAGALLAEHRFATGVLAVARLAITSTEGRCTPRVEAVSAATRVLRSLLAAATALSPAMAAPDTAVKAAHAAINREAWVKLCLLIDEIFSTPALPGSGSKGMISAPAVAPYLEEGSAGLPPESFRRGSTPNYLFSPAKLAI